MTGAPTSICYRPPRLLIMLWGPRPSVTGPAPSLRDRVLTHSIFGGWKQFCDGFGGNFASLALDSFPQLIKRLSLLSGIVCSLFESTTVVFDGVKENHSQRVHLLCKKSDAAAL